jgi:hypothetical protein
MSANIGYDNLKLIAEVAGVLSTFAYHVFEDGKITTQDLFHLPKVFPILGKLTQIDSDMLLPEFKDLDAEELAYLEKAFVEYCQIPDAKIDALVESGFKVVITAISFLSAINKGKPLQLS